MSSAQTEKYDVIVVGAGFGGYPCAIRLAQLKKKVLIIEARELGGVCLNWGCIPTKSLLSAAQLRDDFNRSRRFGFRFEDPVLDLTALRQWQEGIVRRLRKAVAMQLDRAGVKIILGEARISGDRRIEVCGSNGSEIFEFDALVVATGTEIADLPGFDFDDKYVINTDQALQLTNIPGSLLVVGAGASGLEMATIYSRLGSRVTVVEIMDQILPGMDTELCTALFKILQKSGIEIFLQSSISDFQIENGMLKVHLKVAGQLKAETFERMLVTVGRRPNHRLFGAWRPDLDHRGYIITQIDGRTSIPGIFSVGDIAGPPLLAHKAMYQGVRCAETIAGRPRSDRVSAVPSCVFTLPSLSAVGLTENEARARGIEVRVGRCPFLVSGKAVTMGEAEGLTKIVSDPQGRILGVHILGAESSSLIGEAVLAVNQGMFAEDLVSAMHPHPTLTETILEAAEQLLNKSIHLG